MRAKTNSDLDKTNATYQYPLAIGDIWGPRVVIAMGILVTLWLIFG